MSPTHVAAVRSGRTTVRSHPRVAVTGSGTALGTALLLQLREQFSAQSVVALDDTVDLCDPSVAQALAGADVLVHAVAEPGGGSAGAQRVLRTAQTLLTAAAAVAVPRVVLITTAMVYGARADNPVPLPEDAPLQAEGMGPLIDEILEVERLAARAGEVHPGLRVTVVRPAMLVGPGVVGLAARHFSATRLLAVRGTRPCWQFCHVADLAALVSLVVAEDVVGPLTVASEGWLEQAEVERLAGSPRIELPASLAFTTAARLHRLGVLVGTPGALAYVVHPWVVPSTRARRAGWNPAYDNAALLRQVLDQVAVTSSPGHRWEAKDAAIGATGAAVAMAGTAALVRAARRRRR